MPRKFTRNLLAAIPVLLAIGIVLGVALWNKGADKRALLEMQAEERQALYVRTWTGFKALCSDLSKPEFSKECRERADFVGDFPECDEECQALVRDQRKTQR